jgi:DUF4097 and DUF4098 domain-containing protein YvlB
MPKGVALHNSGNLRMIGSSFAPVSGLVFFSLQPSAFLPKGVTAMKPTCLVAALVLFVLTGCYTYDYEIKATRTIDFSAHIAPGQTFLVSAPNNHIDVNVTHGDSAVCKGKLTITVNDSSMADARRRVKETTVTFKETSGGVNVNVSSSGKPQPLVFDVTLPRGTGVELRSETGNVTGNNVDGPFKAVSQSGMVTAEDVSGPISLKSDTGAAGVEYSGDTPRAPRIAVSADSGRIQCDDVAGDVNIESQNGDIDVSYWKLAPGSPTVKIRTDSGAIDFTAPPGLDARVDVSTADGHISGTLPVTPQPAASSKTIQGTVGSGKGSITLQTTKGDIEIHEAEDSGDVDQPARPTPVDSSAAI